MVVQQKVRTSDSHLCMGIVVKLPLLDMGPQMHLVIEHKCGLQLFLPHHFRRKEYMPLLSGSCVLLGIGPAMFLVNGPVGE